MTAPMDTRARARCLAKAQGSYVEIVGKLCEEGMEPSEAARMVDEMGDELERCGDAGRMQVKELLFSLASGTYAGPKLTGAELAGLQTFAQGYTDIGERKEVAKLVDAARRKKDKKPVKLAVAG